MKLDGYYSGVLGQILNNDQPRMKKEIDFQFNNGYEFEGITIYSFESLRIHEAVQFLEDNWEYLEP
jgi:hypothetical protein